ncbi:uncharacterized protein SPPG_08827 [Spizellomyces punctatus DAOM BR117]|uniref:Zn(2)-C6 fungal-type domain-containing protein n=1 Tax=Spizellomyces punctatus (strain DAOM BR117) TaxID=645134 RepID=A0A0L0HTX6_SPIPD|nr:uncharacterized protein SPPG_08827 [Spizellomyces punctatus DAOM BR117]KND04558.1 hypothetical protein SPPG_08827 [Spizellomyces punctatus DAOM BR117]|eukprot:XP_016612597.1 hypothetical protein SPPG_08827 [Spizellomyces punctatus DAOM BR117]
MANLAPPVPPHHSDAISDELSPSEGQPPNESLEITGSTGSGKGRMVLACDRCRTKKRRCNGVRPVCNNCQRAHSRGVPDVVCNYATTTKKRGRKKGYRDALLQKLNYLESMLMQNEGQGDVNGQQLSASENFSHAGRRSLQENLRTVSDAMDIQGESGDDNEDDLVYESPPITDGSTANSSRSASFARSQNISMANLVSPYNSGQSPVRAVLPGARPAIEDDNFQPGFTDTDGYPTCTEMGTGLNGSSALSMNRTMGITTSVLSGPLSPRTSRSGMAFNNGLVRSGSRPGLTESNSAKGWPFTEPMYKAPTFPNFSSSISEIEIDPEYLRSLGSGLDNVFAAFPPHVQLPKPLICMRPGLVPELYIHLLACYFTFVNVCFPMFDEVLFFEDLIPVNRHPPALLNALCAYGCLHSRHTALFETPYHNPRKAAQYFFDEAVKEIDSIPDSMQHVQLLVLLGVWDFGQEYRGTSWQYISLAIREAEKIQLGYKTGQQADYLYTLWKVPGTDELSPLEVTERRRTWAYTFAVDTFSALVSGLHPGIEEGDYAHVLIEAANHADDHEDLIGRLKCNRLGPTVIDSSGRRLGRGGRPLTGEWKRVLAGHPMQTIHDFRPEAWSVDAESLDHICSHNKPWVLQIAYVIRRVLRCLTSTPLPSTGGGCTTRPHASIILSVLPPPTDPVHLHYTMISWWASTPEDERAYRHLGDFLNSGMQPALPSVAQLWSLSHTVFNLLFPCAISMLHHRNVRAGNAPRDAVFAPSILPDAPRCTSANICVLALRAQAFVVRSVYAAQGFTSLPFAPTTAGAPLEASASEVPSKTPFSPSHPAAPTCFLQSPMTVFALFATCLTFVSKVIPVLQSTNDLATIEEGLGEIERLFLPTMDNCSRVWKITGMYAAKLREAVAAIRSGNQALVDKIQFDPSDLNMPTSATATTSFSNLPSSFPHDLMSGIFAPNSMPQSSRSSFQPHVTNSGTYHPVATMGPSNASGLTDNVGMGGYPPPARPAQMPAQTGFLMR